MNNALMHVNFHLLRQQQLGNDYTHIEAESVDDYINIVIQDLVKERTNNQGVQEGKSNLLTEQYYEGLEPLIRTKSITQLQTYPFNNKGRVVNLNTISTDTGERFIARGSLVSGTLYRIVTFNTGDDFSNIGSDNQPSDVFTARGVSPYQPINRSAGFVIRDHTGVYIPDARDLDAGVAYTMLEGSVTFALADIGVEGITVDGVVRIPNTNLVADLTIDKGSTFVINTLLTPLTWSNCSIIENLDEGDTYYKFIGSSSKVDYSNGRTPVTKLVKNRLVRARNVEEHLNHSRGTVISSPLSHMEGGNLIVYQNADTNGIPINERFTINEVVVRYYKKPNVVSSVRNIDCDLDEIDHPEILRRAVELSTAANASQNNATIVANNNKTDVI